MLRRSILWLVAAATCLAAVPTPKEHLGYEPGTDYKLADYEDITGYFRKLAASTNRMTLVEFGQSSEGKPMILAIFSSPENLAKLDELKSINRRLALAEVDEAGAKTLAARAKAFVWIDSGLHASEVAPAQHSPELAYRIVTDESEEGKRIRENVVLLQVPVINPDGLDHIAHWYRKNVGTPYELAPLPWLYQKYSGHDNNRDWYMLNLPETRHVSRLLFQEWFPQIVYNQHQAPPFPARIFVPPYGEPLNPNIPAPVMEGINLIGAAMKERFARENKPGVVSYLGFDAWWNGGLRSVPAFHNMHGILTETALYGYATPHDYRPAAIPERFSTGIPAKQPSVFYERPWLGGRWGVRDAIEYMLTGDYAILDLASSRAQQFAYKAYETARQNIDQGKKGGPYAYVLRPEQWDASSANEMVRRLSMSGVQVQRALAPFEANGKQYPEGSLVLLAAQPFRGYLVDLMEVQSYPEMRNGPNGPVKRPYDIAGWTLPMQMNVAVDRLDQPFTAQLERLAEVPEAKPALKHSDNAAFPMLAAMLARGEAVRMAKDGSFLASSDAGYDSAMYELKAPRVALYEPFTANMDTGWTQWLLDYSKTPYTVVHNADLQKPDLHSRFDVILFASQSAASIMHGSREGERPGGREQVSGLQRPEYTGGIGTSGVYQLEQFVRAGGTLVAFNAATELPLQFLPIPVRNTLRTGGGEEEGVAQQYYCPGSLLRGAADTTNPLAFGIPKEFVFFTDGGQAFESALAPEFEEGKGRVKIVARYAERNVLASGFLTGERAVQGRGVLAEASLGAGKVILFGFRPQHRGQTFGTFKFVLNAIYLSSAKKLSQ